MKNRVFVFVLALSFIVLIASFLSYRYALNKPQISPTPSSGQTTPTPVHHQTDMVNIYMIALEDNGKTGEKIGCGDSVVPVSRKIMPTITPLREAYEELLSVKGQYYGQSGLYNSLYQSKLDIQDLSIDAFGNAVVQLIGSYALGGVCDGPRFQAQLEKTALQFPTVKSVDITINGKKLKDIVSEKGE